VTEFYDIPVETLDGSTMTMSDFRGKTLLIVNVASQCGFTPQYRGLETLYRKFKERGFVVLGFPCNQFGRQEPGSASDIREFCDGHYGISFPMFAKIDVNGRHAHPLYRHLKSAKRGFLGREAIAWNFTKFLVDKNGQVVKRYGSRRTPEEIEKDVARLV
jgi:glutathione peroxidase